MTTGGEYMNKLIYRTSSQQLNHLTKSQYETLRLLCHTAKNMYNVGVYNVRQHYFDTKEYLPYEKNYHLSKLNENYKILNSNMAQQILRQVDVSFKSFFGLLKLAKRGSYDYKSINLPRYLEKDGFYPLVISQFKINNNGYLTIPMSRSFKKEHDALIIKTPSSLKGKTIKEIKIMPKFNARFFEIRYIYEIEVIQRKPNNQNALAIDLGIDNLCTCTANNGKSFIIDGKRIKSVNQWFNKENARLQSIKDKQKLKIITKKQALLYRNRNNKVKDYINKTVRYIINYCIAEDIGIIILGYNKGFQFSPDLGKRNNQKFTNLPLGVIKSKLKYLCNEYGIALKIQEESYTSKADFLANDEIPKYDSKVEKKYHFSGKRITRGQYQSSTGVVLNADVNGSFNIMRKSNTTNINLVYNEYLNPKRIRIA